MPAHRDWLAPVGAEEIPVSAGIELLREVPDLAFRRSVAVVILTGEQHAEQQHGSVDARQLDVAEALAALHVEEMVEEALIAALASRLRSLGSVPEEAQRRQRQVARVGSRTPAALDSDGISGEPE